MKTFLKQYPGWLGVITILLLSTAMPTLADGGGWPTATPTARSVLLPDSTHSPVLVITPISNSPTQPLERKFDVEADPALVPQGNPSNSTGTPVAAAQNQTSNRPTSLVLIVGVLGLVVCVGLVGFILLRLRRRNQ